MHEYIISYGAQVNLEKKPAEILRTNDRERTDTTRKDNTVERGWLSNENATKNAMNANECK